MHPSSDAHGGTRSSIQGARTSGTVDREEIAKFAAMAESWWDPKGKFRPLHRLNPVRVGYIRDRLAAKIGRDPLEARPLAGLSLLDIGCGGGLLTEPMARLGAEVTGIDAAEKNIRIARLHAEQMGLKITYLPCAAEDLVRTGQRFDAVLAMEVIEHVADIDAFITAADRLLKPDGLLFVATLNRTAKSFALAIVGVEYVLRWLPRGTHQWERFVTPEELGQHCAAAGLRETRFEGMTYNPLRDAWSRAPDTDVNYLAVAIKPA